MSYINMERKELNFSNINPADIEKVAMESQRQMQEWADKKATGNLTDREKKAIKNQEKMDEWLKTHSIFDLKPGELATIIDMTD